jgi:hypothetical protein
VISEDMAKKLRESAMEVKSAERALTAPFHGGEGLVDQATRYLEALHEHRQNVEEAQARRTEA